MFISKREAEERLAEGRNIFREPPSSQDDTTDAGPADVSDARQDVSIEVPQDEHQDISLSQLDGLLHPRIHGRANYRMKLESQVAIAESSLVIGQTKTSRVFGLSEPQTQAYTQGLRTTSDITNHIPPKPDLSSRINKIKIELAEKAAARLDETLNALSASKIGEIKRATNLSKVAKDMAVILDKCTENKDDSKAGVHFHIFVPDPVDADKYPTVTVGPRLEGIGYTDSRSTSAQD